MRHALALFLSGCLLFQLILLPAVYAQSASTTSASSGTTSATSTTSSTQTHGATLNLSSVNLSSTVKSMTAPVTIKVGTTSQTVQPGQMLTPAETVAVYQVMRTGSQNIVLNGQGAAIGGSITLNGNWAVNSLSVPQNVTAIFNASNATSGTLNLSGNLVNAGSFYTVSTNPGVTTANISALNITNLQGGLLTSVLPAGGLQDFQAL